MIAPGAKSAANDTGGRAKAVYSEMDPYYDPITTGEFQLFAKLIYKLAGIHLRDSKISLVSNRLRRRLRALNLGSYREYYDYISKGDGRAQDEIVNFIDAITTNETYFFRHETDFDFLREVVIPEVESRQSSPNKFIKIWSAASSTGEEPYSIAMTAAEALDGEPGWSIQILASDINVTVLNSAQKAVYGPYAVSRLNDYAINKYFERLRPASPGGEEKYSVKPHYKKMVKFKRHNLKEAMRLVRFDCIFCRNVLIYFDNESKTQVVENLYNALNDGGYLILGHAESLMRIKSKFKYVRPSVYKR